MDEEPIQQYRILGSQYEGMVHRGHLRYPLLASHPSPQKNLLAIRSGIEYIDIDEAKRLAEAHFEKSSASPNSSTHTSAHFESLEAGQNLSNRITSSDLLAVQNLYVTIPARAIIGILEG